MLQLRALAVVLPYPTQPPPTKPYPTISYGGSTAVSHLRAPAVVLEQLPGPQSALRRVDQQAGLARAQHVAQPRPARRGQVLAHACRQRRPQLGRAQARAPQRLRPWRCWSSGVFSKGCHRCSRVWAQGRPVSVSAKARARASSGFVALLVSRALCFATAGQERPRLDGRHSNSGPGQLGFAARAVWQT